MEGIFLRAGFFCVGFFRVLIFRVGIFDGGDITVRIYRVGIFVWDLSGHPTHPIYRVISIYRYNLK